MTSSRLFGQTIFFGIALLSVQGTIYLFQLAAAAQMSADDYSRVRVIESLAAIGALVATFGLPSVALVKIGLSGTELERRSIVIGCVTLAAAFALLATSAILLATHFGFLQDQVGGYILPVILLSALMSLRLLLVAVTQSRQHFVQLAGLSALSCAVSFSTFFIFGLFGTNAIDRWLWARVLLELGICLGLMVKEFVGNSAAKANSDQSARPELFNVVKSLAIMALPIGASLVMRSLVENGPVLWLASTGATATTVAQVGIVVTLGTISLVPGGVVQGVIMPRLAMNLRDHGTTRGFGPLFVALIVATSAIFVALVLLSTPFLAWANAATFGVIASGAGMVLAKMACGVMGGYLLVSNHGRTILVLNSATLASAVLMAGALAFFNADLNLSSVMLAILAVEGFATACYGIATTLALRDSLEPKAATR